MSQIKLAGRLPNDGANGLVVAAPGLIRRPGGLRVGIFVFDCETITTRPDTGEIVPTARIRRAEIVLDQDLNEARHMVMRSLEQRTSPDGTLLPLDFERELGDVAEAFTGSRFLREAR
jgi:hypothetical protein